MMKYYKIRIIILIVTIIAIIFSTNICVFTDAKIHDKFILMKNNTFRLYEKDNVLNVNNVNLSQDMFKTVSIIGWSFVETEYKNDNRFVKFYFISDENVYSVDTVLSWREIFQVFKDKKIQGREHGYATEFSTLKMQDGEYNIYLETYENDKNYGIVNTGKVLSKKDGKVKITVNTKDSVKVEINKSAISNKEQLAYHIDIFKYEDGIIHASGWCFIKGINKTGKIYIGLEDDNGTESFYSTEQIYRYDIGRHFKDDNLSNSAFRANILMNDGERYKLTKILLEYDGKYYSQNIGQQGSTAESIKAQNYSSIFNIDEKDILNSDNILINIDNRKNSENTLTILGWTYLKDLNKTGKIYVGIKNKTGQELYYTTERIKRPDVVKHFNNNPDLLNSGFNANIKLDNNDDYKLTSIIIEYDGKYYKKKIK